MPSYPWFLVVAFVAMAIAIFAPMVWRWRHGMGRLGKAVSGFLGAAWIALVVFFPTQGGAIHFYRVQWADGTEVKAVEYYRYWSAAFGFWRPLGKPHLTLYSDTATIELNDMKEIAGHADKLKATPQQVVLAAKVIAEEYDWRERARSRVPGALDSFPPSINQWSKLEALGKSDAQWSSNGSVGKRPSDEVPDLEKWQMSNFGEGRSHESLTMGVLIAMAAFLAIWNGWPWLASKLKKQ